MTVYITKQGMGKPCVLFHGWGFDSFVWTSLVKTLLERDGTHHYQLYLVDLPGFGRSPYMTWEIFKASLLNQLPPQFALLGWSMGGLMATRLAAEEPSRVTALINLASTPRFIQDADWVGIAPRLFEAFYQQFSHNPQQTRAHFIKAQLPRGARADACLWETGCDAALSATAGLKAGLALLTTWDLRSLLSELKQPVYYLFGRLDTIVPNKTMAIMKTIYPQFQYHLFRKSAHMPFLSHQTEFIQILDEVLQ